MKNTGVLNFVEWWNRHDSAVYLSESCRLHLISSHLQRLFSSSVASHCTTEWTETTLVSMMQTHTNDHNTHKASRSLLAQDPNSIEFAGKLQGLNKRYGGQETYYCPSPATVCSRDIIERAIFLWDTWELLLFLAPTESVLCCMGKQKEAEHCDIDRWSICQLYIFPSEFFHQKHILVPRIYHVAQSHCMSIMCVSVILAPDCYMPDSFIQHRYDQITDRGYFLTF